MKNRVIRTSFLLPDRYLEENPLMSQSVNPQYQSLRIKSK